MSHFTVTIVVKPEALAKAGSVKSAIETMLAPYQENNMGDCPREYMEFNDVEDEYREEWKSGKFERVVMPDGRRLYTWDDEFRVDGSFGLGSGTHSVPPHLEVKKFAASELWTDFDEFVKDYHGAENRDPETNRFGYWENPNRKWDWYSIGGRWSGYWPIKDGIESVTTGTPGVFNNSPEPGYADVARLDEIDFDRLESDVTVEMKNELSNIRRWQGGEFQEQSKELMEAFGFLGPVQLMLDLGLADWKNRDECIEHRKSDRPRDEEPEHVIDYQEFTNEWFMENMRWHYRRATYATLDEHGWHAPGEMGWFGCSSDGVDDRKAYAEAYFEKVYNQPKDTTLVMVDCHI